MTASRNSTRRARVIPCVWLAAAVLAAGPAAAQQSDGPVQLFPSAGSGAVPAPRDPAPEPAQPSTLSGGAIAVQPLDRVGVDGVGLIDQGTGGLPVNLWARTPAVVASALVSKIPAAAPSPVMHDLAVRLLTSAATAPRVTDLRGPELLPARLERLMMLGEAKAAADLAALVPAAKRDENIRRLALEARLLEAEAPAPDVCGAAREGLAAFDSPWWQKLAAFCALTENRPAEAQMALAMLRETGHRDAPFFWAAERLSGIQPAALSGLPATNPLLLAMLRRTGEPLPAEALGPDAAPWLLAAVAQEGPAGADRLAVAERAAASGALSPAALDAVYAAQDFTPEELAAPIRIARTPQQRARLARLAGRQTEPAALADVLVAALEGTAADPLYPATARLHAEALAALPPTPDLLRHAVPVARALFTAGRTEQAMAWVLAAERAAAQGDRTAERAAAALWPYARAAEAPSRSAFGPAMLDAWRDTQRIGDTDEGKPLLNRRHALVLGLLQALGEPVHSDDWLPVLLDAVVAEAPVPDAAILRALDLAAADGRMGETVALALIALGNEGPAQVHPEATFRAVAALRAVGLTDEARALALEAMAAAGV